ncbi:DUF4012 domain-containing protein [Microbispora cellulosiformans]|uniref:DUF4012 domain-containing protein n=1 Tax=Microbispora cellulosiformans TaxID=2614688 RepID=A0A5J5K1V4_9ACTN|nr:DUF4012 domain-containing protein [Microbispora cellulosiformans]KAA9377511.1 DUF4012 domain-containing protein [Microbispora cellulosiformans]
MTPGRTRRLAIAGLPTLALGLTLAGGWAVHLGLGVRDHLEAARAALLRARPGDLDPGTLGPDSPAAAALADALRHAAEARRLSGGVYWAMLTHLPVVGDGAATARGLAASVADITGALVRVERSAAPLLTAGARAPGDLRRAIDALDAMAPVLRDAAIRVETARALVARTPASTGLAALDGARGAVLREAARLRGFLDQGAEAAALLPPMLGRDGPRRYFLAFETNAEARGTGGLVGAIGVLTADHGSLSVTRLSADNGLASSPEPVADLGPRFLSRYGRGPTTMLSVSNLSPHFPYAATTWTGLWRRQTGQTLDGAVATDPVGLSYLLDVIGPVRLPGGETVTEGGVVDLTERAAYARYPDPRERKKYLIGIAGAVSEALTRRLSDPVRLLPALSRMVGEQRLRVWSRAAGEQRRLAETPLGGVLPERPGPYAGLVVNNSAGTKLDYYLDRSLTYALGPCRPDGTRASTVRIRLTNDVPRGTLPAYVTGRLDTPRRPHAAGSNLLWVSLYAATGAKAAAVRLDGRPIPFYSETERSHPVFSKVLEFAPGQSRTLEFDLLEPYARTAPVVPVQPLVRPQRTTVTADDRGCSP